MQHAMDGCICMAHGKTHVLACSSKPWEMLVVGTENAVCAMQKGVCSKLWSLVGLTPFPEMCVGTKTSPAIEYFCAL